MKIKDLTLKNYRAFSGSYTFKFSEGVTVIAGINGRGKTAILDAIALCVSRLLPQISPAKGGYRSFTSNDVSFEESKSEIDISANCAGIPLSTFRVSFEKSRTRTKVTRLSASVRDKIKKNYGKDKTSAEDAAPLAIYYTTDRAGYRIPNTLPASLPKGQSAAYFRALANRTVNYRDLMARIRVYKEITEAENVPNPLFLGTKALNAITRCLDELLIGFTDLRVALNPLRLLINKNGSELNLAQMSDGERSFLALITDLCRRLALANPELDSPLDGEGIVLIDEIELHLHPQWQTEVIHKLRRLFPHIQFIATTHSPYVVRTLEANELILLDDLVGGDFTNKGLEEVSSKIMNVNSTEMTPRYREMLDVAKRYFQALRDGASLGEEEKTALKAHLEQLTSPYADNPAYQAFLEMHRTAALGE